MIGIILVLGGLFLAWILKKALFDRNNDNKDLDKYLKDVDKNRRNKQ